MALNTENGNDGIMNIESLCPICLKKIKGKIVEEASSSYMIKSCPEHGTFKTIVWKGNIPIDEWKRPKERANIANPAEAVNKGCPYDCGLCPEHRQHTCTALIEVTQNCNLNCKFCFAGSTTQNLKNPTLEEIKFWYGQVMKYSGACNIQLSGGEPTLRDDLPEIIKIGIDTGFNFIQLNTNGIRLGENEHYLEALKEAGLSSIFLQFDGTNDEIYQKLRGRKLYEKKIKAIENCEKYNIGVILVPTIVPDINRNEIWNIIKLGIDKAPTVRGVHFQPVSYFGRIPEIPKDEDRITLPELMDEICAQSKGLIKLESFKPPGCENSLCSFHGNYIIKNGKLQATTKKSSCGCSSEKAEKAEIGSIKAKDFVVRNWSYFEKKISEKESDWDRILTNIKTHSFSISGMAFQDVWNVNLNRVKDCCIHVVSPEGKLIPFCMYNISSQNGDSIYRSWK